MKNYPTILSIILLTVSCGGGVSDNNEKINRAVKLEDRYREINMARMDLSNNKRDAMSRLEQENFDNEMSNLEKLVDDYVKSLVGTEQSGKCLFERLEVNNSVKFIDLSFGTMNSLTEEQLEANSKYWDITCREFEQPSDERGIFATDRRGSKYSFEINEIFLTEQEKNLLNNIRPGEQFSFRGAVYLSSRKLPWGLPTSGLDIHFKNNIWDYGAELKNTEKTIFFN
jgi:hypothetical protein